MSDLIRPGQRFTHDHFLLPGWKPDLSKGEKYADGPKALMRVTAVRNGRVYYCYDTNPSNDGGWGMDRRTFLARYADQLTTPEGAQP